MQVFPFAGPDAPRRLDIAIDGADQVDPDGWAIKGGGAAHTREKTVAAAADRFVIIASSDKMVDRLGPPVPLELLAFGLNATLARLGAVKLRDVPLSPDGGVIADYIGRVRRPGPARRRAVTGGGRGRSRAVPARDGVRGIRRPLRSGRADRRQSLTAAASAMISACSASTRPPGMERSPARSFASASTLSAPVTSHITCAARFSTG